MSKPQYRIESVSEPRRYWNRVRGWEDDPDIATLYTATEREKDSSLPDGGCWVLLNEPHPDEYSRTDTVTLNQEVSEPSETMNHIDEGFKRYAKAEIERQRSNKESAANQEDADDVAFDKLFTAWRDDPSTPQELTGPQMERFARLWYGRGIMRGIKYADEVIARRLGK